MFSPLNLCISIGLVVVLVLGIVGMSSRQFTVEVMPVALMPTYRCEVGIFFYHRTTQCPNRDRETVATPRREGFFDCIEAYDKFRAAFVLAVIGLVFAVIAIFFSFTATVLPPSIMSGCARAWTIVGLCAAAFVLLTVSWPLVRVQVSEEQCGRRLKGYVTNLGQTVIDPAVAHGHWLIVVSWIVSFGVMVLAVVAAIVTMRSDAAKKEGGGGNAPDAQEESVSSAVDF